MGVLRNGKRKGETRLKVIESRARSATLPNMGFVWSFVPEAANNRSEHTSQKPHKQGLTTPPRCGGKTKRNMGTCLVHARLAPPHPPSCKTTSSCSSLYAWYSCAFSCR